MEKASSGGNRRNAVTQEQTVTQEQKEYASFQEKVKRTVYLDNLSPLVTVPILKTALGQFGVVVDAQILPNYLDAKNTAVSALVEMQNEREAENTIAEITVNAFMIAGQPRPVRAKQAKPEMFPDRPALPGRKIQCYWVDSSDPDWEGASQLKQLAKKHAAEASMLLKYQREEENKLGEQQEETLRSNYKKYELIDGLFTDNTTDRLCRRYHIRIRD